MLNHEIKTPCPLETQTMPSDFRPAPDSAKLPANPLGKIATGMALVSGLLGVSSQEAFAATTLRDHVTNTNCWNDTQLLDHFKCSDTNMSATAWTTVRGNGQDISSVSVIGTPISYPSGDPAAGSALTNFSRWKLEVQPMGTNNQPGYTNSVTIPSNPDYQTPVGDFYGYGLFKVSVNATNSHYTLQSGQDYRVTLVPEKDAPVPTTVFAIIQSRGGEGSIGTNPDLYQSGVEGFPLTSLHDLEITYDFVACKVTSETPAQVPVSLDIRPSGTNVVVSWPQGTQHQGLYQTTELRSTNTNWTLVPGSLGTNSVTIKNPQGKAFFRLKM